MRGANDYVFFVRRQCEDISTLRCKTASCSEEPDCEWPKSAAGFEELRCTRCSGELALHWQREIDLCADHLEPLALGADTLDASFIESYGVWYSLCARATIGNKAFEAGATATTAPADVTEVPQHLRTQMVCPSSRCWMRRSRSSTMRRCRTYHMDPYRIMCMTCV